MITPIEKLENSLNLKEIEAIEEGWITRLTSIYPYGLNVRANACGVMDAVKEVEGSNNVIYGKFEKIDIRRHHRGGGQSNNSTDFDAELLISELINPPTLRNMRIKITQLNQEKVKLVYLASITRLKRCIIEEKVFLHVIKDLCLYRCKCIWERAKENKNDQFLVVSVVNKYVEDLALSKILKDTEIKKLCPLSGIAEAPIVSYRYLPAIRSQILNYRQTHEENLDPTSMSCDCSSSDFRLPGLSSPTHCNWRS